MTGYFEKITRWFVGSLIGGFAMWGCEADEAPVETPLTASRQIALALEGDGHVDSAQVMFFRQYPDRDTLYQWTIIRDITSSPKRFNFRLPAGKYIVQFWGNVATDRVELRAPYSSDSIRISYQGQGNIPVVYYGFNRLDVGVDSAVISGLILVTAAVELTVKKIPAGVDRVVVDLLNTDAGVFASANPLEEQMNPPVTTTITPIRADSSYTVNLSSFTSVDKFGNSRLEVRCYNIQGNLLYTGQSVSFPSQAARKRVVACSFGAATKGINGFNSQLNWEYDEDFF